MQTWGVYAVGGIAAIDQKFCRGQEFAKLWKNLSGYLCWAAWDGVMALAMFAVYERVRLTMSAVSIDLCTLGGARSMEGKLDRV